MSCPRQARRHVHDSLDMPMKIIRLRLTRCLCIVFLLLLAACGGSGGGDNQPSASMTWDEGHWNEVNWQ